MKQTKSMTALIAIIALGVGLAGGYFFKDYQVKNMRGNFTNGQFQGRPAQGIGSRNGSPVGQANLGGGLIQGEVISQDDKSITVKLTDGSTKIIILSDSTFYSEEKTTDKSVLKVGLKVGIFGISNSDGSITAQNIQINPLIRGIITPSN